MITLNKWSVAGFGCIQSEVEYIPQTGATLWVAANGTGKTTMLSALIWGLYGKPLKDIPTADIPTYDTDRTSDFIGTRVVVNLTLHDGRELVVARHIKYKGTTNGITGGDNLHIWIDGNHVTDKKNKIEQNEYLEGLLGISYKTLLNSSVFGQRLARLAEASPADQRAQFEELFQLDWLATFAASIKPEATEADTKLAQLVSNEGILVEQKQLQETKLVEREQAYNEACEMYDIQAAELAVSVAEVEAEVEQVAQDLKAATEKEAATLNEHGRVSSEHAKLVNDYEHKKNQAHDLTSRSSQVKAKANSFVITEAIQENAEELQALQKEHDAVSKEGADIMDKYASKDSFQEPSEAYKAYSTNEKQAREKLAEEQSNLAIQTSQCKTTEAAILRLKTDIARLEGTVIPKPDLTCSQCGSPLTGDSALKAQQSYDAQVAQQNERLQELTNELSEARELLASYRQKVDTAEKSIETSKGIVEDWSSKAQKAKADDEKLIALSRKLDSIEAQQKLLEAKKQNLKKELERVGEYQAEYNSMQAELNALHVELDALMKARDAKKAEATDLTTTLNACTRQTRLVEEALAEKRQELSKLNTSLAKLVKPEYTLVQATKDEVAQLEDRITKLKAEQEHLKQVQQAYKLLISSTAANGIKARVIGGLLSNFNDQVNRYAKELGVHVVFSVDETKDSLPFKIEVNVWHQGEWKHRAYEALSGGQQQRVNIAVTFGLATLLDSINPLDFTLLDEVFEGLDAEGLEAAYSLLNTSSIAAKKCIVISHQQPHGLRLKTETLTLNKGKLTIL